MILKRKKLLFYAPVSLLAPLGNITKFQHVSYVRNIPFMALKPKQILFILYQMRSF